MNEKLCKTCGQMISQNARTCPHCGHTYSQINKIIAYPIIFIVCIVMIDYAITNISSNKEIINKNNNPSIKMDDNLFYLKQFEGKYPSDVNLFNTEPLKTRLNILLGPKYSFFTRYSFSGSIIKIENNFFQVNGFREHNAEKTCYLLFIDLESNIIEVGINDNNEATYFSENKSSIPELQQKWEKTINELNNNSNGNTSNQRDEHKIGSIITNKEIKFSVERAGYYEKNKYIYKKDERNRIFFVSIYLKNLELSSLSFNAMDFTIKDSHGYVYEPTSWGQEPLFTYGSILKGEVVRGYINFEIPPDISEMKLIYSLSPLRDNKIAVNLYE